MSVIDFPEAESEEEEAEFLTLTDEDGNDTEFEYLDVIEYNGTEYLILMPADELEAQIVIMQVEPVDEETENYFSVTDEDILEAVYGLFKDKWKDTLTFEEE